MRRFPNVLQGFDLVKIGSMSAYAAAPISDAGIMAGGRRKTPLSPATLPATEHKIVGMIRLMLPNDPGTNNMVHSCGLHTRDSPTLGVGLGVSVCGRVPPTIHRTLGRARLHHHGVISGGLGSLTTPTAWGRLPLTAADFRGFREHGPCLH